MEDSANKQKSIQHSVYSKPTLKYTFWGNMVTSILQMKYTVKYLLKNIGEGLQNVDLFSVLMLRKWIREELFRSTPTVTRVLLKRRAKI